MVLRSISQVFDIWSHIWYNVPLLIFVSCFFWVCEFLGKSTEVKWHFHHIILTWLFNDNTNLDHLAEVRLSGFSTENVPFLLPFLTTSWGESQNKKNVKRENKKARTRKNLTLRHNYSRNKTQLNSTQIIINQLKTYLPQFLLCLKTWPAFNEKLQGMTKANTNKQIRKQECKQSDKRTKPNEQSQKDML